MCTTTLAKEIPSAFFRVLGTIYSVCVALLWLVVFTGTVYRLFRGQILVAPCLKDVEGQEEKAHHMFNRKKKEKV